MWFECEQSFLGEERYVTRQTERENRWLASG